MACEGEELLSSVLHMRRSLSPSTLSSSSSFAGGRKDDAASIDDWETILAPDNSLLRWISGDPLLHANSNLQFLDHPDLYAASLGFPAANDKIGAISLAPSLPMLPGLLFDEKPQILNPALPPPQAERHNCGGTASQIPRDLLVRKQQIQMQDVAGEEQALVEQLYKAAELVGAGELSKAQGILARLNHQLSMGSPPLHRAAFCFKETLQSLLRCARVPAPTPLDVIFKMGAYKVFSEVSPLVHFVNFTSNQALLEALASDHDRPRAIHIVDFDIGLGAQWASFLQELPLRWAAPPPLRITAFASPATHHHVELTLVRDNLAQFAADLAVPFDLDVLNLDAVLDQTSFSLPLYDEAVAVNFPLWTASARPTALPNLLRFVKHLSPKIVVSADRGSDRTELPLAQHVLEAVHCHATLLESLDAANVAADAVNKIEKLLLQPRMESAVLGRLRAHHQTPPVKTLFTSAGFAPMPLSNFTETQAECILKRTPQRGFHVEKRGAALALCWHRRHLISVSAWR